MLNFIRGMGSGFQRFLPSWKFERHRRSSSSFLIIRCYCFVFFYPAINPERSFLLGCSLVLLFFLDFKVISCYFFRWLWSSFEFWLHWSSSSIENSDVLNDLGWSRMNLGWNLGILSVNPLSIGEWIESLAH